MVTATQIKAARALLGMKQSEIASIAGVSLSTLNNIERSPDTDPKISTLNKIQKALEELGIVFSNSGNSLGVTLKAGKKQ